MVVVQVYAVFDYLHIVDILSLRQALVLYLDGVLVIRPRTNLDRAQLLVEREKLDVDRTQTFVDRRRLPDYAAVGMNGHFGEQLHRKVTVSATNA